MTTIEDQIKEKIERAARWERENPGQFWCNPDHLENEPKIYITVEMLNSDAFRSLSRRAMLVFLDFLSKREMVRAGKRNGKVVWQCLNNGEIIYTYSEANERGVRGQQFPAAIDELQAKGFIDIKHQGRGGRKPVEGSGDVSLYWIDDRWKDYGTDNFRPPRNPRRKDTRQDRGWGKVWAEMSDDKRRAFIHNRRKIS
jgi:hypothetical protein